MTREEAIRRFENVKANALIQKANGVSEYWQEEIDGTIEAIDMAIEALSADADCSTCKHKDKDWDSEECDSCCGNNNHYASADADAYTRITGLVPDARPQMEHDREWIIGCIKHDGFIKTDRFDKANQIILEALSADAVHGWIPCTERLPEKDDLVLVTVWNDVTIAWRNIYGGWESAEDMYEKGDVIAWMPLPSPYREDGEA